MTSEPHLIGEHRGLSASGPLRFAVVENLVYVAWGRAGEPTGGGMYLTPRRAVAVAEDLHRHAEAAARDTLVSEVPGMTPSDQSDNQEEST